MRWRGRRQSGNIEDRRGRGSLGRTVRLPTGFGRGRGGTTIRRAGGGGIGFLIVIAIVALVFGINPLQLLGGAGAPTGPGIPTSYQERMGGAPSTASGETRDFVATVLAETEDVWNRVLPNYGLDYREPTLVLFSGSDRSACGFASAASGPFYCPADSKVYLDLSFFEELRRRFGAPGDFAQAYVIAHEVGHHIQNLTGVLPEFNRLRQRMSEREANAYSVRVELQADCYSGIWAHHVDREGLLEQGDIDEALNAAHQIGDDVLQKRTQGYVVPDAFNHGTAEQRQSWFQRGYRTGDVGACDTFEGAQL